jgi:hypothetical protein
MPNEDRLSRMEQVLGKQQSMLDQMLPILTNSVSTAEVARQYLGLFDLIERVEKKISARFDLVDQRFDKLDTKVSEFESKLDGVIDVVDKWDREPPIA